jgi:AAA family ATP:ADP antiporter
MGSAFFFIIFSYTMTKELKDSIFMGIIGSKGYIPLAKVLTIIALVPVVFFYSKLVDTMRRYRLLCFCAAMYSLLGLVFAYFVGHHSIGLANEVTGPYRIFGWLFYFYVESFTPFVLSVFWAFLNSVSNPKEAKQNYGILISFSKVGGMASAGLGWGFLYYSGFLRSYGFSDTGMIQLLMTISSLSLLLVPVVILVMMKKVSGRHLHGYEAAYKFEKKQSKQGKEKTGMWSGLFMLLKYPYTFGIFGVVLFYEVISSVLSYQRLGVAQEVSCGVAGVSCFLLGLSFAVHCVGFFISFFGTRTLVTKLGERLSLLIIPISMGTLLFYYTFLTSPYSLLVCFVVVRAIYYAFNQPVTEALYIPTVKAVKFKSKSWIDTFGKKMAKGVGSAFNGISSAFGAAWFQLIHAGLFGVVIILWIGVAYLLGKRYAKALKNQEVIGAEEYE